MTASKNPPLVLSVEKCFTSFNQSAQRLQYFLCIANNISTSALPDEWYFLHSSGMRYTITKPPLEKHEYLIDGFRHSLHGYVVRDCIESFSVSLDQVHFAILLHGKTIRSGENIFDALSENEKKKQKDFEWKGLSAKFSRLLNAYGIDIGPLQGAIDSLKSIRDCFAHSNGIVRQSDGLPYEGGKRRFTWTTISIYLVGEDSGKEYPLILDTTLSEASLVQIRFTDH